MHIKFEENYFCMYCNIDNLCNEIEKLRTTLNEMSIALVEGNRDNNIELLNISVKMDDLINKYIELKKNKVEAKD